MSRADDPLNSEEGDLSPLLEPALRAVNGLIENGLIKNYAIGGSIAILYYSEPFRTKDVDIFCYFPADRNTFEQLDSIWQFLTDSGHRSNGPYMNIKGVLFQFLPPPSQLEQEAMDTAISTKVGEVATRVFQLEYAIAAKVNAGRDTDWVHISTALNSAEPDMSKLKSILSRFKDKNGVNLLDKWRQQYHGTL